VLCKHVLSTVVYCLTHPNQDANAIHLARADGTVLCGEPSPVRVWYRPGDSVGNWRDQVCPQCLSRRLQPAPMSREEFYAVGLSDEQGRSAA
jgi:hypothetical protein